MTKIAATAVVTLKIAVLAAFIVVPASAEASFISLVTNIFKAQAATTETTSDINSQKMALLEAPVNPNTRAGASSDIMVEDSALVAEISASSGKVISETNNKITTYKVKSGDTITEIAEKFGISANTILWANDLKRTSTLSVGQTLIILPINGVQHTVAAGETLQSIAKKHKGDVSEIISYNNLESDKIKIGDSIVIPDGELSPAVTPPKQKSGTTISRVANAVLNKFYVRPILAGVRTQGLHGNNGVDLADSCGTPIFASAAGEVTISKNNFGWNGGYGNYVVISHDNGSQTLYSHMQAINVREGMRVIQGQQIGTVGATGKVRGATGCHVHFEIRNGPTNPF